MWQVGKRYEAVEIDGRWYVIDHKYPELVPEPKTELEAKMDARVWNLVTA